MYKFIIVVLCSTLVSVTVQLYGASSPRTESGKAEAAEPNTEPPSIVLSDGVPTTNTPRLASIVVEKKPPVVAQVQTIHTQELNLSQVQAYAYELVCEQFGASQWPAFNAIVNAESSWNPHATEPTTGAYGLPQALPGYKMASAGDDWHDNPQTQLRWMVGYIKDRYGSPGAAWSFHLSHNWY